MRMGLPPLPKPSKDFVDRRDLALQDFVAKQQPLKRPGRRTMLDTPFVGACTVCRLSASLAVDPIDYKTLERVLEGRVIKAQCPRCRKTTEFRPLTPEELAEDQFHILKRQTEIRDKIFRAAQAKGIDVPTHVEQALGEYMKRMESAIGKVEKPGELSAPDPKIIVPE